MIPQLRLQSGAITVNYKEINSEFKEFYVHLYSSESPDDFAMNTFLNGIEFPTINKSCDSLEKNIQIEEIKESIASMKSGKAPGPDGFPTEFYKVFPNLLSPILLLVFSESLQNGCLPASLYQATISLLLKKDKNPLECGSYRPISLLNCDYKILAKLLSICFENSVGQIISPDQTGFIRDRYYFSNIRRLFNILYSSHSNNPEVVLSLDAEKVFDRVEWNYLFQVLGKFGFGHIFTSWIKLLYAAPKASVRTNDVFLEYFNLQRGTRQGCPLSPLLFAIAIEPLAIALRSSAKVCGITRAGTVHKVSLYADDLLLFYLTLSLLFLKLFLF